MYKLYDKAFKIGFVLNLCIFAVANIVAYIEANKNYSESEFRMMSGRSFPAWGFPFNWTFNGIVPDGPILNFIAIVASGFVIGVTFRYFRLRSLSLSEK